LFRALSCLLVVMAAVSSGAVLGSRSRPPGMDRAASPRLVDAIVIALCWTGALLTYRWRISTALTLAIWITMGLLAAYTIHRIQSQRWEGKRQWREFQAPATDPSVHPRALNAGEASTKAWGRWRAFASELGGFQSRLILRAVYYCVFAPFGLSVGLFGDPLNLRGKANASSWQPRESGRPTLEDGRRQF
jgi:hypothetical protein